MKADGHKQRVSPDLASFDRIAAAQHSLITRAQMRSANFSDERIKSMVARGTLLRTRRNVFALAGVPESFERGLHAVVLCVGDSTVASHSSAAYLWSYSIAPERWYEVTTPRDQIRRVEGVSIHRSEHFDDVDLTTRSGIPATTFERTLCDCSTRLSIRDLSRVFNDGLRRGVASVKRLQECAERIESGPGRHMSAIRALLAVRESDFNPGGSDPELRVLEALRPSGLVLPLQQYTIHVGKRRYRPDYVWPPPLKIFAEYYGMAHHSGVEAVIYDSERITALAAAGWLPLIFTKASTDREIVERTAEALASRTVGKVMGA
jgi:hypothetical protein